jgi:hypothetical protein
MFVPSVQVSQVVTSGIVYVLFYFICVTVRNGTKLGNMKNDSPEIL